MSKKKKRISSKSLPEKQKPRAPIFEIEFREDLKFLARNHPTAYDKVWKFIDECLEHPFTGTGKPEPLKHIGSDLWSRRVTIEHRLVYQVGKSQISFLTCRYHY